MKWTQVGGGRRCYHHRLLVQQFITFWHQSWGSSGGSSIIHIKTCEAVAEMTQCYCGPSLTPIPADEDQSTPLQLNGTGHESFLAREIKEIIHNNLRLCYYFYGHSNYGG